LNARTRMSTRSDDMPVTIGDESGGTTFSTGNKYDQNKAKRPSAKASFAHRVCKFLLLGCDGQQEVGDFA
jgi:hypothetical protein